MRTHRKRQLPPPGFSLRQVRGPGGRSTLALHSPRPSIKFAELSPGGKAPGFDCGDRMKVFHASNYKEFLLAKIEENKSARGYKTRLAEAAGCQSSFLSQVLHGHIDLTPEHAIGLANFWEMSELEREYFMDLVNLARSGTPNLRAHFEGRLKAIRAEYENMGSRFQTHKISDERAAEIYFLASAWHHSAIHTIIGIPAFRTARTIAKRLNLPEDVVLQSLESLEGLGLCKREAGEWVPSTEFVIIPKKSPLWVTHHSNWRQRAVFHASSADPDDRDSLHNTGIFAVDQQTMLRIRELGKKFIEDIRTIVNESTEEDLFVMNLDLFRP